MAGGGYGILLEPHAEETPEDECWQSVRTSKAE